jgi:hypothetical protein
VIEVPAPQVTRNMEMTVEQLMPELLVLVSEVLKWKQVLPVFSCGELFLLTKKKRRRGSVLEIDSFADEILCECVPGRTQRVFCVLKKW